MSDMLCALLCVRDTSTHRRPLLVVDSADVLGSEEDILCANVKGKLGQLEKEEEEGGQ